MPLCWLHVVLTWLADFNWPDFNEKESKEFVESLSSNQFNKVREFFDNIPKLYKDVDSLL